jgi:hypothetical protein
MMLILAVAACTSTPGDSGGTGDTRGPDDSSAEPVCIALLQSDGTAAGFEECTLGDGVWSNRTEAVDCATTLRDEVTACDGTYEYSECAVDAECGTAGFCALGGHGFCVCETSCATDEECGAGRVCMCAVAATEASFGTSGECREAGCMSGADCESGSCGVSLEGPCSGAMGTFCRTETDSCRSDADCSQPGDRCMYREGAFVCSGEWVESCE